MKGEHIDILILHRLEQARNALNDAHILLEHNGSSQSIVNRAYYGMFYSALALLQKIGSIPSKHTGVISTFDREFHHKGIFPKELSKAFHEAFDLRQTSDYKTIAPISKEKAIAILREAEVFVDAISYYLKKGDR
jgi:uncharacterized protein (UPF0332 family)